MCTFAHRTDPSSEPGRWQTTFIQTDFNQSRSEWVDVDMEMERRLNQAYDKVGARAGLVVDVPALLVQVAA
jgi:hypothetical protein